MTCLGVPWMDSGATPVLASLWDLAPWRVWSARIQPARRIWKQPTQGEDFLAEGERERICLLESNSPRGNSWKACQAKEEPVLDSTRPDSANSPAPDEPAYPDDMPDPYDNMCPSPDFTWGVSLNRKRRWAVGGEGQVKGVDWTLNSVSRLDALNSLFSRFW